jgi:hypothetical protein
MQGEKKELWMELCKQAAVEQDPEKLLKLVTEINRLLYEKQKRLKGSGPTGGQGGGSGSEPITRSILRLKHSRLILHPNLWPGWVTRAALEKA